MHNLQKKNKEKINWNTLWVHFSSAGSFTHSESSPMMTPHLQTTCQLNKIKSLNLGLCLTDSNLKSDY